MNSIREIRLKVSDLFEIDPQSGNDAKDLGAITAYVLKHYGFLPKPIDVTLEDDDVLISFPEEADAKKEEARRLADRAVKRASEGNYEKAIGIYKRVLELQPSFHSARRDLAGLVAATLERPPRHGDGRRARRQPVTRVPRRPPQASSKRSPNALRATGTVSSNSRRSCWSSSKPCALHNASAAAQSCALVTYDLQRAAGMEPFMEPLAPESALHSPVGFVKWSWRPMSATSSTCPSER